MHDTGYGLRLLPMLLGLVIWLAALGWGITFTILVVVKLERIIQLLSGQAKQPPAA